MTPYKILTSKIIGNPYPIKYGSIVHFKINIGNLIILMEPRQSLYFCNTIQIMVVKNMADERSK